MGSSTGHLGGHHHLPGRGTAQIGVRCHGQPNSSAFCTAGIARVSDWYVMVVRHQTGHDEVAARVNGLVGVLATPVADSLAGPIHSMGSCRAPTLKRPGVRDPAPGVVERWRYGSRCGSRVVMLCREANCIPGVSRFFQVV
jgi:hypothetical protein